jgi:hypothetical protein
MDFKHLPTHVPSIMPNHFNVHNVRPHFINVYTNNSVLEWPCQNIGNTDTPPNSLKDSNASPKIKTTKEKGVGVSSLAYNISEVKGAC